LPSADVGAVAFDEAQAAIEQRIETGIETLCRRLNMLQLDRNECLDNETCKFAFFDVERMGCILRDTLLA